MRTETSFSPSGVKITVHIPEKGDIPEYIRKQRIQRLCDILNSKEEEGEEYIYFPKEEDSILVPEEEDSSLIPEEKGSILVPEEKDSEEKQVEEKSENIMQQMPRMDTINNAAETCNISRRFLRELISSGKVATVKSGNRKLVNLNSLADYLNNSSVIKEKTDDGNTKLSQEESEHNYSRNLIKEIMGENFDGKLPSDYRGTLDYLLAEKLTEREQQVISMRYCKGMTYKAIGNILNVSNERIRQIIQKAIRKLRYPKYQKFLKLGVSGAIKDDCQKALDKTQERHQKELDGIREHYQKMLDTILKQRAKDIEIEVLDLSIENMGLSVRAYNCLKRAGFSTLKDIICCSKGKISGIKNMGVKTVDEIEKKIFSYGYNWASTMIASAPETAKASTSIVSAPETAKKSHRRRSNKKKKAVKETATSETAVRWKAVEDALAAVKVTKKAVRWKALEDALSAVKATEAESETAASWKAIEDALSAVKATEVESETATRWEALEKALAAVKAPEAESETVARWKALKDALAAVEVTEAERKKAERREALEDILATAKDTEVKRETAARWKAREDALAAAKAAEAEREAAAAKAAEAERKKADLKATFETLGRVAARNEQLQKTWLNNVTKVKVNSVTKETIVNIIKCNFSDEDIFFSASFDKMYINNADKFSEKFAAELSAEYKTLFKHEPKWFSMREATGVRRSYICFFIEATGHFNEVSEMIKRLWTYCFVQNIKISAIEGGHDRLCTYAMGNVKGKLYPYGLLCNYGGELKGCAEALTNRKEDDI